MHIEIEGRNTQTVNTIQLFCWGGERTRISRDCAPDGIPVKALCPERYPAAEFKAPELWSVFPRIHLGFAKDEQHCQGAVAKPYVSAPQIYDSRTGQFVRGGVGYQPEPEPGLVAVGISGRSGKWLDAVGLVCGKLEVTEPPAGLKAQGRVRLDPGAPTGPPRAICDLARQARARNSPAAPGLEESCRAAGAAGEVAPVKAQARVKVDPTGAPPAAPRAICDLARQARARNSPAAPGLEKSCRDAGAAGEVAPIRAQGRVRVTPPDAPVVPPADAPVVPPQVGPTITANTNPVIVPNGQDAGTTTITWTAAPDYAYSEIYLSVDNGEWSEFARGGDGSKPTTIKPGTSQTFRMMIYEGQAGTPKIIATLTVTARN
jgi:hypothetical protein